MTFSRLPYLDEVLSRVSAVEPAVDAFCLRANAETSRLRLTQRGTNFDERAGQWCCRACTPVSQPNTDPRFGELVHTEQRSVSEVADHVRSIMRG
jgi:hypothetical protein